MITSVTYSISSDRFDEKGKRVADEKLEKIEVRALVEHGITDDLTALVQPEWRSKSQGEDSEEGLGRIDLGLRQRVWFDDNEVISLQGAVRIPGSSGPLTPLNGGDTEWELDGRLLYGRGFTLFEKSGFADIQGGYRHRFGAPPDEIRLDLTVGVELKESVLTMVQSFNTLSLDDGSEPFDDTQEHQISVSSVYQFSDKWSVQAGGTLTAYGKNVLREQGFFLALWAQF